MTTATIKPVKGQNFAQRIIERHQHKIIWIGMPVLCCAIWGMAVAAAVALCQ